MTSLSTSRDRFGCLLEVSDLSFCELTPLGCLSVRNRNLRWILLDWLELTHLVQHLSSSCDVDQVQGIVYKVPAILSCVAVHFLGHQQGVVLGGFFPEFSLASFPHCTLDHTAEWLRLGIRFWRADTFIYVAVPLLWFFTLDHFNLPSSKFWLEGSFHEIFLRLGNHSRFRRNEPLNTWLTVLPAQRLL